jgi:hypothetical protein
MQKSNVDSISKGIFTLPILKANRCNQLRLVFGLLHGGNGLEALEKSHKLKDKPEQRNVDAHAVISSEDD